MTITIIITVVKNIEALLTSFSESLKHARVIRSFDPIVH